MLKKKLALLFPALALSFALLAVTAAAFSDVDSGLYYAAPIAWAVEKGITTGTSVDTFSPDALCTRGQIITFLWRAAGSPEPSSTVSPYSDVTPGMNADFYRAILWAGENEIIRSNDLDAVGFSPNAPCSRAAAVRFLWRYAGSPDAGVSGSFTDVPSVADYAQAVAWAVKAGITSGTTDTTFSPGEVCTRGQIATFLYRCLNKAEDPAVIPEDIVPSSPAPAPQGEARPLQTLIGEGDARSLGLDGSDFTADGVYEADVTVEIYSPTEAVFTVEVPFPLFQACNYTVRFVRQDGTGYVFTFLRWDEAFADILPWDGGHYSMSFTDLSGSHNGLTVSCDPDGDDRMGGILVRRVTFAENSAFSFHMLEDCTLTCEVNANL